MSIGHITYPELDTRQVTELRLALYYTEHCNHGTDGHHRLNLLALSAKALGVRLDEDCKTLLVLHNPRTNLSLPNGPFVRSLSPEETLAWAASHGEMKEN